MVQFSRALVCLTPPLPSSSSSSSSSLGRPRSALARRCRYDLMLFTNFFMMLIALGVSLASDQFWGGIAFVAANPDLMSKVRRGRVLRRFVAAPAAARAPLALLFLCRRPLSSRLPRHPSSAHLIHLPRPTPPGG